jgi:hypothetical protein
MGGKSSGGNEAAQARADEQQRQERIRQGTARIAEIFDGSTKGSGQLAAGAKFDPNATYYKADGSVWSPSAGTSGAASTGAANGSVAGLFGKGPVYPAGASAGPFGGGPAGLFGGGSRGIRGANVSGGVMVDGNYIPTAAPAAGGSGPSAEQQFAEMLANGGLYSGTAKTGGFDDAFYQKRRQAYIDYAKPQLDDQYGDAQKQLTFALARTGNLDSSVRGQKAADLQKQYDLNQQQIADQALASETDARNAVEDARANLIATLNATGDAEGAANSALARAAALSQPAAFSPLSSLFADFTSALGTKAAADRAEYYGGYSPGSNGANLFGRAKSSVRVS